MLMLLMLFDSHLRSCCVVSEQLARLTQVFAIGQGILGWTGQEREEKGFDTVRDKKAFLSEQCREIEDNNRMGKRRDLFKKIQIPREHFMQRWAQ